MIEDAEITAGGCARGCLYLVVGTLLVLFLSWKVYLHNAEMARIPSGLDVDGKVFQVEEGWGIGPGANETGLVVYELDEVSSRKLIAIAPGMSNDARIRSVIGKAGGNLGDYGEWKPTPVQLSDDPGSWGQRKLPISQQHAPRIREYLGVYGFGIDVDPATEAMVDRIISSPGAYYAYGRGGSIIIVAPLENRLIFAYAG